MTAILAVKLMIAIQKKDPLPMEIAGIEWRQLPQSQDPAWQGIVAVLIDLANGPGCYVPAPL
jgi:hypothetical protein